MTRKVWLPAAVVVLAGAVAAGGTVARAGAERAVASGQDTSPNTAKVARGTLSAMVSQVGTLTYRARPDGSPYPVINQATGVYTQLPQNGDRIACGGVLYRVDDDPVLLLCGAVPAYRDLHVGDVGKDVRQLNRNLHQLGYDAGAGVDPGDDHFTWRTGKALERLQRDRGVDADPTLAVAAAVFLPEPVRIAKVTGELGGPARPGAPVLQATSAMLHVQVTLDPSQQGAVAKGDVARVTLPGNRPVAGRVEGFGRVAQVPPGPDGKPADATIPTYVGLDDPRQAQGLDAAPVDVAITTEGVANALSVPVTALLGKSGGGFAVEVVRAGGRRELVAVELGLFDSSAGRVQVAGELSAGDDVVVPSS